MQKYIRYHHHKILDQQMNINHSKYMFHHLK
jgi:hypothetical protein